MGFDSFIIHMQKTEGITWKARLLTGHGRAPMKLLSKDLNSVNTQGSGIKQEGKKS